MVSYRCKHWLRKLDDIESILCLIRTKARDITISRRTFNRLRREEGKLIDRREMLIDKLIACEKGEIS